MNEKTANERTANFRSERTIWHLNLANRRMLIALCVVCFTFIATIIVFVRGYTIREKNWLDTFYRLNSPPSVEQTSQADP